MISEDAIDSPLQRGLEAYHEAILLSSETTQQPGLAPRRYLEAQAFFLKARDALEPLKLKSTQRWETCPPYGAIEYYLGLSYLHDPESANMWDTLRNLFQCARYFVDYLWTLFALEVPGLENHYKIVQLMAPTRYSRLNLTAVRRNHLNQSDSIMHVSRIAALENRLENIVDLDARDIEFFQYTASHAISQVLEITNGKLPACFELSRIDPNTVPFTQPSEVVTVTPTTDIWESIDHERIKTFYTPMSTPMHTP